MSTIKGSGADNRLSDRWPEWHFRNAIELCRQNCQFTLANIPQEYNEKVYSQQIVKMK